MPTIDIGEKAPNFTLRDQAGKAHSLSEYAGQLVVLYFYPKDDTPGCTAEACQFRDNLPELQKTKAVVLGVSPDDADSHRRFAEKHSLNFTLLADVPGAGGAPPVSSDYGVWVERQVYGAKHVGVVRTTYLIDTEGKVARRWDNVKVPGHIKEVAEAVKVLHSGGTLDDPDGEEKPLGHSKPPKQRNRAGDTPSFQPVRGPGGNRGPAVPKRGTATQRKPSSPG